MQIDLDLSVCIVTFMARDMLRECLYSVFSNQRHADVGKREYDGVSESVNSPNTEHCSLITEVIVVDNGSQDGTLELLREKFPSIQIIENKSNLGYSHANNQALAISRGRYALLLNPDTKMMPKTLDRLVDFMDANPRAGICTPKVLNRDGTLQKQCRRSYATPWDLICYYSGLSALFPKSRVFARYLVTYEDENKTHTVDAVSGSCMMIRRETMNEIGFLDERFFAYQEDTDYCLRANQAGWQVYYYPGAQIVHYASQGGSRVNPYRSIFEWHRSYWLYYRKNLASRYFFLFNWFYYFLMLLKLASALLVNLLRSEKFAGSRKP